MRDRKWQIAIAVVLLIGLILIRFFQRSIFYDPMTDYYVYTDMEGAKPTLELSKYYISLTARYFLNTIVSLIIIHLVFGKQLFTKTALKIYLIAFFCLMIPYMILFPSQLDFFQIHGYQLRRLLAYPIILLVLIPWFYMQLYKKNP